MAFIFDDKIVEINREIYKRRPKWQLKAIAWMDYDDVAQILRIHIHKKWNQWDQNRDLAPWLNTVISHQIRNVVRNIYSNFCRPCLKCAANQGDTLCSIYGKQDAPCPLYIRWEKTKKRAHDVKLPVAIDNHSSEVHGMPQDFVDIEKVSAGLHARMFKILKPIEKRVYQGLYIDMLPEEKVAAMMGYKTSEIGRSCGYKRIRQIKKIIIDKAKAILRKDGIESM